MNPINRSDITREAAVRGRGDSGGSSAHARRARRVVAIHLAILVGVWALAQRWAEFFAGLLHGSELPLVTVHVLSGAELVSVCGGPHVLGCYGDDELVISGEART